MDKKIFKRIVAAVVGIAMAAGLIVASPALTAKAANSTKGAYTTVSFENVKWKEKLSDEENDKNLSVNRYNLSVEHKTKSQVTKNMTMSNTIYIPKDALKKDNSRVDLDFGLDIYNKSFQGYIQAKYKLVLENHFGYVVMWKEDTTNNWKMSRTGSMASYKKKGDYYVITVKDLPLLDEAEYWPKGKRKTKSMDKLTKTYTFRSVINFGGQGQKMTKKKIYVSDMAIKAKKTVTTNFTSKDYTAVDWWSQKTDKTNPARVGKLP